MKPEERAAKLVRMAEILESRAADLRELIVAETGSVGFLTDFVQAAGSIGMFRSNAQLVSTSFNWVGCNSSGSTCQASSANTGSTTYSVTASNQFGAGAAASASVSWQTPPASRPNTASTACADARVIERRSSDQIGAAVTSRLLHRRGPQPPWSAPSTTLCDLR